MSTIMTCTRRVQIKAVCLFGLLTIIALPSTVAGQQRQPSPLFDPRVMFEQFFGAVPAADREKIDRIEIVMPLPTAEVVALRRAYEDTLDRLMQHRPKRIFRRIRFSMFKNLNQRVFPVPVEPTSKMLLLSSSTSSASRRWLIRL